MSAGNDQYLLFSVGKHQFGITIDPVREIVEQPPLIPLPEAPPCIAGVCLRDDRTVPVLDLRVRLNLKTDPSHLPPCMIVMEGPAGLFAIRADNVTAVVTIRPESLDEVPSVAGTVQNREAVAAIGWMSGISVVILNPIGLSSIDPVKD